VTICVTPEECSKSTPDHTGKMFNMDILMSKSAKFAVLSPDRGGKDAGVVCDARRTLFLRMLSDTEKPMGGRNDQDHENFAGKLWHPRPGQRGVC
jgi:hypothetical protein